MECPSEGFHGVDFLRVYEPEHETQHPFIEKRTSRRISVSGLVRLVPGRVLGDAETKADGKWNEHVFGFVGPLNRISNEGLRKLQQPDRMLNEL